MNGTNNETSQAAKVKPMMSMPVAIAVDKIAEARDTFRHSSVPARWIAALEQILRESDEVYQ